MWYKEWFDSDYYHLLYRHRDEQEAELFMDRLVNRFGLKPGMKILDLPCGRGRHAVYLEKKGFEVTGADLSTNSISFAREFETDKLHFRVHNMLDPFPETGFDAVLNLFTSFGYFDDPADDQKALHNMSTALKQGGVLVIDFLNPSEVQRNLVAIQDTVIDDVHFHLEKKIENGFVVKTVSFSHQGSNFSFCEKVRLITREELCSLLVATGLQIIDTFGDYSLGDYSEESSDRLIITARKN